MGLTMRAYPIMARMLHEFAHDHTAARWVATGGGGYQAETVVPRVWAIHFAEMCGASDRVPTEWLEDRSAAEVSEDHRAAVERSVASALDRCLPALAGVGR
jgi:acetoin utilization protein AcuC